MNQVKAFLLTPIVVGLLVGAFFLIPVLTVGLFLLILGSIVYMLIQDYLNEQDKNK